MATWSHLPSFSCLTCSSAEGRKHNTRNAQGEGRQDGGVKIGRPLQKQLKVSEAVVLTRAGPEPRNQTRDKADRLARFSRTEGSGHTPQARKRRPRGKKERALHYLKEMKHGVGKEHGIWGQKTRVQVPAQLLC